MDRSGVLAAVGIAAPYLIWQQRHGWPQVTVAHNIGGSAEGGRAGFIPFQLVMVSIFLVPVWIAGLLLPFRRGEMRLLRFLPLAYLGLAAAYLLGNGKAYYLASLYPALLGLGALPVADWTLRHRRRLVVLIVAVAASAAMNAFIALPLLPERSLQGSLTMKLNPDLGENVGWPRFINTVGNAWRSIPARERAHTAIFAATYHEAGAVDVLGQAPPPLHLQRPQRLQRMGQTTRLRHPRPPPRLPERRGRRPLLQELPNARHRQQRRRPQQQRTRTPRPTLPTDRPLDDPLATPNPLRLTPPD